ncbi:MAG TPA: acetate--CoA ligase family protein [Candidatus Acidoferrales bacterium]|nr:acetate--CoA ligase family protein [Candidatus Acidoferrales bacterium]
MIDERVRSLFSPSSVAIVGASSSPDKQSGYPLRNLLAAKFSGKLYPVNPRAREIQGIACYPSIADLPEVPDVAIVMVEAALVPGVAEECARQGVKALIVGAGGFSEAGPEGAARQQALARLVKEYGIRICGPNCHGVYNVGRGIPLGYNFSFALRLLPGPVAIASQSGALLGALAARALKMGQGLSYIVSSGNEVDLGLNDYLEFFLEDRATAVVALLIEGLEDGARFLELVKRAHSLGKTVVALKVGKSERGALTTMAHTSRMAGAGEVYEAAFRQFGVISTDTVEAFLAAAQMAAHQPPPRRGKLMVMTSTGAGASLMADKAKEYGIELAEISRETEAAIPERKSAILANPFDTAGQSRSPGFLGAVCSAFAADKANDCLLMLLGPLAVRREYAASFCEAVTKEKKAALAITTLDEEETAGIFRRHHIPVFHAGTDACFRALRAFIEYGRFRAARRAELEAPNSCASQSRARAEKILGSHPDSALLPERATRELLHAYGFKTPPWQAGCHYAEVLEAARRIGFPVILKGVAPDLAHKSEAGLVSRAAADETALASAYESIARNLAGARKKTEIAVERFIPHDHELILGIKHDATFGPVVLFGLGGVYTEVLRDYAIRIAPITRSEAERMVLELKAFAILEKAAARGLVNLDRLIDALLTVSRMALDLGDRIAALDINPLAFGAPGGEMTVLDAKVHLRAASRSLEGTSP